MKSSFFSKREYICILVLGYVFGPISYDLTADLKPVKESLKFTFSLHKPFFFLY